MQYDDDDDDVDFNLGNGSSGNNNAGGSAGAGAGAGSGGFQRSEETPQPSGGGGQFGGPRSGQPAAKVGPNSKEDGYVYFLRNADFRDNSRSTSRYAHPFFLLRDVCLLCVGFLPLRLQLERGGKEAAGASVAERSGIEKEAALRGNGKQKGSMQGSIWGHPWGPDFAIKACRAEAPLEAGRGCFLDHGI